MSKSKNLYIRIEPDVKENAEMILTQLGIPMSNAVGMFLKQVILHRGLPFDVTIPRNAPLDYSTLSQEQFDAEIRKGIDDLNAGRVVSAKKVREEMQRQYGI